MAGGRRRAAEETGGYHVAVVSPGLPHDGNTLRTRSLGGSETAAILVTRALAARGHRVTVFANLPEGPPPPRQIDGVTWRPLPEAPAVLPALAHDVEIISRDLEACRLLTRARLRILWCHDLMLKRQRGLLGGVLWSLDAIYVLSCYHAQQVETVTGPLTPGVLTVTRNGVDLAALRPLRGRPREPGKLIYGSRPERGLGTALAVIDWLVAHGVRATLHVAWYENTPPPLAPYYEHLWGLARQRPYVRLLGPLPQAAWHAELATAEALLYPGVAGEFREISCIVAMEAMAVGTPVVACAQGALPETLGARLDGTGRWAWGLVGDEATPIDAHYVATFAARVAELLHDRERWRAEQAAGLAVAETRDWADVAAAWEADWTARFTARARPRPLMAQRFLAVGDRERAQAMAAHG